MKTLLTLTLVILTHTAIGAEPTNIWAAEPTNNIWAIANPRIYSDYDASFHPVLLEVRRLWTNRTDHLLSILRTEPISSPCLDCGAPSHHDRQLLLMATRERLMAEIHSHGTTNIVTLHTWPFGPSWVKTNLVSRSVTAAKTTQPGWPPLPVFDAPTNNVMRSTPILTNIYAR